MLRLNLHQRPRLNLHQRPQFLLERRFPFFPDPSFQQPLFPIQCLPLPGEGVSGRGLSAGAGTVRLLRLPDPEFPGPSTFQGGADERPEDQETQLFSRLDALRSGERCLGGPP